MSGAAPEGEALGWAVLGSVEELGPATALALVQAGITPSTRASSGTRAACGWM